MKFMAKELEEYDLKNQDNINYMITDNEIPTTAEVIKSLVWKYEKSSNDRQRRNGSLVNCGKEIKPIN